MRALSIRQPWAWAAVRHPMRALSIRQPWAWAVVHGFKPVENRTWWSNYLGPLAIHAGKTFDDDGYDFIASAFPEIRLPSRTGFELGGFIGAVDMVGCVAAHPSRWFFGPKAFVFENPKAVPLVAARGMQGLFDPAPVLGEAGLQQFVAALGAGEGGL